MFHYKYYRDVAISNAFITYNYFGGNMMRVTLCTCAVTLALLAGCATPTVVQTRKAADGDLNCVQLKDQITEAEDFEANARKERGVTGTNVAAAILFWPALVGTYKNTEDAIEAAKERQKNLYAIAKGKNCSFAK